MKKPLGYEEWVREFLSRLCTYFNLPGWSARVIFSDEENKDYADTTVDSTYLHMTIRLYKTAHQDFEDEKMDVLIMALIHEMVHVFLDPFHSFSVPHLSEITTPYFMNMLEQQTQKLTMVFLKNLPKNLIPPR